MRLGLKKEHPFSAQILKLDAQGTLSSHLQPQSQLPQLCYLTRSGAVTTRFRKTPHMVWRLISVLVRGVGAVDSELRTSHCCRKYSHSSAGAPSEMRMSRGLSSAVKWQKPGSRNLEGERNWEHEVEWV